MAKVEAKQAAHVRQALNERANGLAHGNTDAVTAAEKRLRSYGVPEKQWDAATEGPPVERQAPPRETTATADSAPRRGPGRPRKSET